MNNIQLFKKRQGSVALVLGLALALLGGCGGGGGSGGQTHALTGAAVKTIETPSSPTPAQTQALLKKGAQLNTAELARAAEAAANDGGSSNAAAKAGTKAATSLVTVYRFYNSQTTAHFYTASETEKATILATLPQFSLDGAAFYASNAVATGLSPVHRFFNTQTGVHFYTISEDEKTLVQASLPQFHYDGVAYYASKVAGSQLSPLFRFYYGSKGFHFYSNSATERDTIINTLPQYQFEGTGYFVMTANWGKSTLKLPHTGITNQQCFQVSSSALVACGSAGATALNPDQDGHRTAVNPMSYSEVAKVGGGVYARTECVRDDITGLIWEGKAASGLRAGGNTYTNYDDVTQRQRHGGAGVGYVNPTTVEINEASNSVGYMNYVNSVALCGLTNWRIPSADELMGIIDYGTNFPAITVNMAWYPNTSRASYWTSSGFSASSYEAWAPYFGAGSTSNRYPRDLSYPVRLVSGRRF
ncbi:hypothetical protein LPB72_08005 [Hydrogenophaga crassostreae]|uniref:DUF1566 domain-containing protein n=1 Tax=Hydrogenophaga crassostreae TaxID=1763535 RepID=A0A167IAJ6_9BURK|nr:DUF1566 domain-containing protein [Hydrogenophaga crassostreae]AOW12379.1 hypothetical protein LPB072_05425 [Hydrogenophaga crassostreae]OAD42429.1 hypothetical protein LPB72_08005 [Hydrogenophaga crassostreae]